MMVIAGLIEDLDPTFPYWIQIPLVKVVIESDVGDAVLSLDIGNLKGSSDNDIVIGIGADASTEVMAYEHPSNTDGDDPTGNGIAQAGHPDSHPVRKRSCSPAQLSKEQTDDDSKERRRPRQQGAVSGKPREELAGP